MCLLTPQLLGIKLSPFGPQNLWARHTIKFLPQDLRSEFKSLEGLVQTLRATPHFLGNHTS